jgi:endoglucanase
MKRTEVDGWVRAEGKRLVNGRGEELILRGVGLGSWLLPEGYMWKLPEGGDRPRRIERMVAELVGDEEAASFWEAYRDRYIAEADIRRIAEEGFNSVRVPFNARMLLEGELNGEGYNEAALRLLDRVIRWCRTWNLYVILDMHGAPGGQTGANIDDSEHDRPELFMNERHRVAAIGMWRMLARRYREEWIVAGYDLLNEPLPDYHGAYHADVQPLYRDMIRAIREVDDRHLIIVEGVHWATDWSIFTERLDDNVLYQFHKYWNNPDTESIRRYLDFREAWEAPIFMGEGGENDLDWYAGAFRLFEDHGISWNFWTWKKMDTDNSPCSIARPEGWEKLAGYLQGGEKPDRASASRILTAYLDALPLEACRYRPEVVRALFRRLPVRIPAIHYGYQGPGIGFGIAKASDWEAGYRRGDGVEIRYLDGRPRTPPTEPGWHRWDTGGGLCVQLAPGDWLAYDFTVAPETGGQTYRLKIRLNAPEGPSSVAAAVDGTALGVAKAEADWTEAPLELPPLAEGGHRIVVTAREGKVRLESLVFERSEG